MKKYSVFCVSLVLLSFLSCANSSAPQSTPVTVTHYQIPVDYAVPPNPVQGASTPAQYDYALFTRYAYSPEPRQLKAILVLMPGLYGGAGDFDAMARHIVTMSGGSVEVWAIDRRSMQIEDLMGLQEAMRRHDPSIAYGYYFSGATVDGRTYAGPLPSSDISYLSEWGLDMTLHDLNAVISLVPAQYRKTNVILGGHSLGAWIVQDYAAYDFGSHASTTTDAGYNNVAGIILLDGGGTGLFPIMTEAEYLSGSAGDNVTLAGLSFSLPGVDQIRQVPDYVTPPGLLGSFGPIVAKALLFVQIAGLYASLDPDALSPLMENTDFKTIAYLLLGGNTQLKATNLAMLGFYMDRHFDPIGTMTVTLGNANGPLAPSANPLLPGQSMSRPTDYGTMVYTWNGAGHISDIEDVADALSNTYTTLTEWYFPMRLTVDVVAFGDSYGVTSTTDWRWTQGLHVIHTPQMDAPVLAFGGMSGLEQTPAVFDTYRDMLPPARDCNNQPRSACGFDLHMMPGYTHMDILLSDPSVPAGAIDPTVYAWILKHTSGSIPVPVLPAP